MSHDTQSAGSRLGSIGDRIGVVHLLASTLILVVATILLGVATKAAGAGLACEANWPVCDGGLLNLFPANVPSFFEWIHRVVAMVAGFFIVGTAVAAWRGAVTDRRVVWAVTLGMVLTPIQVLLGRETVLAYEMTVLNLHFWTAVVIFVLFAASAVLVSLDHLTLRHVRWSLGVGTILVPLQVLLSPLVIDSYTPVIQTTQYAFTLALLFAVIVAAIVGSHHATGRVGRGLVLSLPPLAVALTYFGREAVMAFDPAVDLVYLGVTGLTFVALLVGIWLVRPQSPVFTRSAQ